MGTYYLPIGVVVLSNVLYHVFQKSIPQQFNPFISLIITYITAIFFSLALFPFYPSNTPLIWQLKLSIWPSIALGFAVVGLEVGFLLAYRLGWNINVASIVSNITVAVCLLPIGFLIYKESFTRLNFFGVLLCIIGLILVNR
ncbi:EamA family transporter [Solidesulfovibrio sp. C21]|uniref:EamA family transporter n=1 Tax=Solidesulfovibrio sp. C21 TaxID=3398613 RepID=UPI0039FD3713